MKSAYHTLEALYHKDEDGGRYELTLIRGSLAVQRFVMASPAAFAALAYALENTDDPEGRGIILGVTDDHNVSHPVSLDGPIGDRLVLFVERAQKLGGSIDGPHSSLQLL